MNMNNRCYQSQTSPLPSYWPVPRGAAPPCLPLCSPPSPLPSPQSRLTVPRGGGRLWALSLWMQTRRRRCIKCSLCRVKITSSYKEIRSLTRVCVGGDIDGWLKTKGWNDIMWLLFCFGSILLADWSIHSLQNTLSWCWWDVVCSVCQPIWLHMNKSRQTINSFRQIYFSSQQ